MFDGCPPGFACIYGSGTPVTIGEPSAAITGTGSPIFTDPTPPSTNAYITGSGGSGNAYITSDTPVAITPEPSASVLMFSGMALVLCGTLLRRSFNR